MSRPVPHQRVKPSSHGIWGNPTFRTKPYGYESNPNPKWGYPNHTLDLYSPKCWFLVGGFNQPTPLQKWWSEWKSVGIIPFPINDGKVIKIIFQTTNQSVFESLLTHPKSIGCSEQISPRAMMCWTDLDVIRWSMAPRVDVFGKHDGNKTNKRWLPSGNLT